MPDRPELTPQHKIDARTLTRTQLRERYEPTYSSWRNMKQRRKDGNAVISPEFEEFADFLIAMGPRPEGHSIDRIDPSNPEYGPGFVRWTDAKGQANNRSTTIMLTVDGETKPLSLWASETGQKADTLRARLENGWSHAEVVNGKTSPKEITADPWNFRPWPKDVVKYQNWESLYQANARENSLPIDFFVDWLRSKIYPLLDFLGENDDIPSLHEKCLEVKAELEPLQKRLDEALVEQEDIHRALKRFPMPPGWCGPRRFRSSPH
jgi:hypothetical protein